MKHPENKMGNHQWVELPPEARAILDGMTKAGPLMFPYRNQTAQSAFTRACQALNIEDLHFHDLRHEGISRLFEMGWTIPQVASVSGHRGWQNLQRYTHIRATGDKWADWSWKATLGVK
jgi:integrase